MRRQFVAVLKRAKLASKFGNASSKLRKNKFISVPAVLVVGIFIAFAGYQFYQSTQRVDPGIKDQPLRAEGLSLNVKVSPLNDPNSSSIKDGEAVRVVIRLDNVSEQHSRFLTIKSGLQSSNFSYIHNIKGATGVTNKDGEITFENVVLQDGQSQEIKFEAIALSSESDREFEARPSLIDTTRNTVLFGESAKFTVLKSNNLPGGTAGATAERVE